MRRVAAGANLPVSSTRLIAARARSRHAAKTVSERPIGASGHDNRKRRCAVAREGGLKALAGHPGVAAGPMDAGAWHAGRYDLESYVMDFAKLEAEEPVLARHAIEGLKRTRSSTSECRLSSVLQASPRGGQRALDGSHASRPAGRCTGPVPQA